MADLFDIYPMDAMSESNPSMDLLEKYSDENMPGTPEQALELAKKQIKAQHPNMPDWLRDALLAITPKEKSPLLDSAARGISNVTDYIPAIAGGALQGASIPIRGVAGLIPTEFTQKLANSPDLRNLLPQAQGTGQNTAQLAGELIGGAGPFAKIFQGAKYLSQAAKLPKALQNATALTASGIVGTPGDIVDRGLGATTALALGGAGKVIGKSSEKISPFVRGLFNDSTPEALIESVQKPHDILQNSANELYNYVEKEIKSRDIKVPIKADLLDKVKEYFPKNTRSYQELLDRAKNGDYEAVHKIQSSLYKKGTKALSHEDPAVENQGEDILDLREKINEQLNNHLIKEGHLDITHVLNQGKKLYSNLQKTYYDKLLPKGIGKLVHPEIRLRPENIENLFKQDSVPMGRFLEKHPETAKHFQGLKEKTAAEKALKKLLYASGGTGASIAGGKAIYDLFK